MLRSLTLKRHLAVLTLVLVTFPKMTTAEPPTPIAVGSFANEVRHKYTTKDGAELKQIRSIVIDSTGKVIAGTADGIYTLVDNKWVRQIEGPVYALATKDDDVWAAMQSGVYAIDGDTNRQIASIPNQLANTQSINALARGESLWVGTTMGLFRVVAQQLAPVEGLFPSSGESVAINQIAVAKDGRVAVAADAGLFLKQKASDKWQRLLPRDGNKSWAPVDVRGVAFDQNDQLWFACPQGVGGQTENGWNLFSNKEGLPFNEFTTMTGGEKGVVWFGTTKGAIRLDSRMAEDSQSIEAPWSYRNGKRWVPDGPIQAMAVTPDGHAWFGTEAGIEQLERRPTTMAEKAKFFEDEIDKYHRRTPFGYVMHVSLPEPGVKENVQQHDSDNDGLWTSMYGAGECFAYAATKSKIAKERATKAFKALAFLSEVTQGGSHPAPPGFPARTILPTSGENPNKSRYTPEKDRQRREREDRLWKIMDPRWPTSADGKWYWKSDTSSDELDGHYFFYACYYDLVAETEEEKQEVRDVVARITHHLVDHDFNLVDHDGKPTRWAYFGPERLNRQISWARGLNSLSILSYLKTAIHIVGDEKFTNAYNLLIDKHHYATNTLWPKAQNGPGAGNQSDDEMAFMCYYNLLNYEKDPKLHAAYLISLLRYWSIVAPERCPLFNYIYAASMNSDVIGNYFGTDRFQIPPSCFVDAVDTLKRIPLDRIRWGYQNSHRIDVQPLRQHIWRNRSRGHLQNGKVLHIDERDVVHWNYDPWRLDSGGGGREMSDGATFLLPYYMGLYHGYITESQDADNNETAE